MRLPQVSERIKEAPAQALRGVFAGIGQLLLITDKLRNKTPAGQQVPRARTPEPSETVPAPASPAAPAPPAAAAPAAAAAAETVRAPVAADRAEDEKVVPARDFDKTGNVRLLTSQKAGAAQAPVTAAAPVAAEAGEPLPNYDELTIASLRARLRNMDIPQLRELVGYEQAHADRADVIAMFERRIAKLQAETTPEERGEAEAEAEIESQEDVEAEVQDEVGAEEEGEE
jgi:hypothetical protein